MLNQPCFSTGMVHQQGTFFFLAFCEFINWGAISDYLLEDS